MCSPVRRLGLSFAACLFLAAASASSRAETILYVEKTTGNGILDGQTFTGAAITITYLGDSSNITTSGGVSILTGGTVTVYVDGVGSDTFAAADKMIVFADSNSSPTASAGIRDDSTTGNAPGVELGTFNASFSGYDLTAPYGPTSGAAIYKAGLDATTSGGYFQISSATVSSFTAVVVPEPSSLILAGTGILGLAGFQLVRRRRDG